MRILIIINLLLLTTYAWAQPNSMTCLSLEGTPTPDCKVTRYHECHSGGPSVCQYAKLEWMIKTVNDPATGLCANNNQTCVRTCTGGADGQECTTNCTCNDPTPVPTPCRQDCYKCYNLGTTWDSGVYCEEFCAEVHCPGVVSHNGELLFRYSPSSTPACSTNSFCAGGASNPNPPTDVSQCPDDPLPVPQPFDPEFCCYTGTDNPPHAAGLPRCNAASATAVISASKAASTSQKTTTIKGAQKRPAQSTADSTK